MIYLIRLNNYTHYFIVNERQNNTLYPIGKLIGNKKYCIYVPIIVANNNLHIYIYVKHMFFIF